MKKTKIKKDLSNKIKMIDSGSKIRGITLISLVITIIVLIILAGVTLNMLLGENGIINRTKTAKEENEKATATETMNLKITNAQISKYAEEQRMPTLKELADNFCEDDDFQYVQETSKVASLTKITNNNPTAIYTKLKAYPYEFEINSSLQLASIDGVKVASVPTNDDDTIVSMTKAELKKMIQDEIEATTSSANTSNNYTTDEQVVGTWIDGKTLYQKTYAYSNLIADATVHDIDSVPTNIEVVNLVAEQTGSNWSMSLPYKQVGDTYLAWVDVSNSKIRWYTKWDGITIANLYVTIQYTKSPGTATN